MSKLEYLFDQTKEEIWPKVRSRKGDPDFATRNRQVQTNRWDEYEAAWETIMINRDHYSDKFLKAFLIRAYLMHDDLPRKIVYNLRDFGRIHPDLQLKYASSTFYCETKWVRPFVYKIVNYRAGHKNIVLKRGVNWKDVPFSTFIFLNRKAIMDWLLENSNLPNYLSK